MTATLGVAHGNGHNKPSLVDWLKRTDWDSAGVNETEHLTHQLHRIAKSRVLVDDARFDRARDTAVLVRDRHISLGTLIRKVSDALGKPGSELNRVAPARNVVAAYYAHPLADELGLVGVCHIEFHPVAGPEQLNGINPRAPIVKKYRQGWAEVRTVWRAAKKAGYLVVLTSDAQLSQTCRRPWGPRTQARRLNARWWAIHIDWVIFDRRLLLHRPVTLHPLFDHIGFIARFTARKAPR